MKLLRLSRYAEIGPQAMCWSVFPSPTPGNPVCPHTIELSGPLGWRRTIRRGALASSRVMFFKRLTNLSGRGAATALGPSLKQSQEVRSNTGGKKASACRGRECFPPNYPNDSVLMRGTLTSSSQLASKTGQTSLFLFPTQGVLLHTAGRNIWVRVTPRLVCNQKDQFHRQKTR